MPVSLANADHRHSMHIYIATLRICCTAVHDRWKGARSLFWCSESIYIETESAKLEK